MVEKFEDSNRPSRRAVKKAAAPRGKFARSGKARANEKKFSESCPIGIVGCGCRVVKTDASSTKHVSSACYYFYPNMMRNLLEIPIVPIRFRLRCPWPLLAFFLSSLAAFGTSAVLSAAQKSRPPSQVEEIYAQGMQALQRGDLPAAETAFNKVLRLVSGCDQIQTRFPAGAHQPGQRFFATWKSRRRTSRGKGCCSFVPIRLRNSTHTCTRVRRIW